MVGVWILHPFVVVVGLTFGPLLLVWSLFFFIAIYVKDPCTVGAELPYFEITCSFPLWLSNEAFYNVHSRTAACSYIYIFIGIYLLCSRLQGARLSVYGARVYRAPYWAHLKYFSIGIYLPSKTLTFLF